MNTALHPRPQTSVALRSFQCSKYHAVKPRVVDVQAFKLPQAALAAVAAAVVIGSPLVAQAEITPVYFGSGCFWGRQKDFVDTEKQLGRETADLSSVVGYAAGKTNSGSTCYYYNSPSSNYEKQGHAEVTQVKLTSEESEKEFAAFSETYFSQFKKTPFGMIRQDPQDSGPGYRNVVGIPGGVDSPLFKILESKNTNKMKLVPSTGGAFNSEGKAIENDAINTVYIVDSTALPFHEAEVYHQYHNGIGKPFGAEYTQAIKQAKIKDGTLSGSSGCMEYPMF